MLYCNSGNRIFWECIVWIYVERDNIEFVHACFFHQELLNLYPLVVQIDKMNDENKFEIIKIQLRGRISSAKNAQLLE